VDSIFFSFLSAKPDRSWPRRCRLFHRGQRSRRRVRLPWEGPLTQSSLVCRRPLIAKIVGPMAIILPDWRRL